MRQLVVALILVIALVLFFQYCDAQVNIFSNVTTSEHRFSPTISPFFTISYKSGDCLIFDFKIVQIKSYYVMMVVLNYNSDGNCNTVMTVSTNTLKGTFDINAGGNNLLFYWFNSNNVSPSTSVTQSRSRCRVVSEPFITFDEREDIIYTAVASKFECPFFEFGASKKQDGGIGIAKLSFSNSAMSKIWNSAIYLPSSPVRDAVFQIDQFQYMSDGINKFLGLSCSTPTSISSSVKLVDSVATYDWISNVNANTTALIYFPAATGLLNPKAIFNTYEQLNMLSSFKWDHVYGKSDFIFWRTYQNKLNIISLSNIVNITSLMINFNNSTGVLQHARCNWNDIVLVFQIYNATVFGNITISTFQNVYLLYSFEYPISNTLVIRLSSNPISNFQVLYSYYLTKPMSRWICSKFGTICLQIVASSSNNIQCDVIHKNSGLVLSSVDDTIVKRSYDSSVSIDCFYLSCIISGRLAGQNIFDTQRIILLEAKQNLNTTTFSSISMDYIPNYFGALFVTRYSISPSNSSTQIVASNNISKREFTNLNIATTYSTEMSTVVLDENSNIIERLSLPTQTVKTLSLSLKFRVVYESNTTIRLELESLNPSIIYFFNVTCFNPSFSITRTIVGSSSISAFSFELPTAINSNHFCNGTVASNVITAQRFRFSLYSVLQPITLNQIQVGSSFVVFKVNNINGRIGNITSNLLDVYRDNIIRLDTNLSSIVTINLLNQGTKYIGWISAVVYNNISSPVISVQEPPNFVSFETLIGPYSLSIVDETSSSFVVLINFDTIYEKSITKWITVYDMQNKTIIDNTLSDGKLFGLSGATRYLVSIDFKLQTADTIYSSQITACTLPYSPIIEDIILDINSNQVFINVTDSNQINNTAAVSYILDINQGNISKIVSSVTPYNSTSLLTLNPCTMYNISVIFQSTCLLNASAYYISYSGPASPTIANIIASSDFVIIFLKPDALNDATMLQYWITISDISFSKTILVDSAIRTAPIIIDQLGSATSYSLTLFSKAFFGVNQTIVKNSLHLQRLISTTTPLAPFAPPFATVTVLDYQAIILSIDPIPLDKQGAKIIVYEIEIKLFTMQSESTPLFVYYNVTDLYCSFQVNITNLNSNSVYEAAIKGKNSQGYSPAFTLYFTTMDNFIDSSLNLISLLLIPLLVCCCFITFIVAILFLMIAIVAIKRAKSKTISMMFIQENSSPIIPNNFIIDFEQLNFERSQLLGTGAQGTVCTAFYKSIPVAVKLFAKASLLGVENETDDFFREAKLLMEHSNHINIVRFIGISEDKNSNQLALITELCKGGSLSNYVESSTISKSFLDKIKILQQIASGMSYLHSYDIIHRDLKCENVLLDETYTFAKIIDFGFSKQVNSTTQNMTMNVGTAAYASPESIRAHIELPLDLAPITPRSGSLKRDNTSFFATQSFKFDNSSSETNSLNTSGSSYDKKSDVYSFAIIMFAVYFNTKNPYGKNCNDLQIIHCLNKNPDLRPKLPIEENVIPQEEMWYIKLMKQCWRTNPQDRPSFLEIVEIFSQKLQVD